MRDCDDLLAAIVRGGSLDAAAQQHVATCPSCRQLAPDLAILAQRLAPQEPAQPSPALCASVLAAAAPLLLENARADAAVDSRQAFSLLGGRLASALLPAVLLFPLLVLVDALLLRAVYGALATVLPLGLTTYVVVSYGVLLGALGALTFGAIPLLVQRQAAVTWKEGHV